MNFFAFCFLKQQIIISVIYPHYRSTVMCRFQALADFKESTVYACTYIQGVQKRLKHGLVHNVFKIRRQCELYCCSK